MKFITTASVVQFLVPDTALKLTYIYIASLAKTGKYCCYKPGM